MSDTGEDGFGRGSTLEEQLHQYGAAAHETLPYAPQHDSDPSLHLPPQQPHEDDDDEDLLAADDEHTTHPTDSHLDDDVADDHHNNHADDLYAEATAAAASLVEGAAASGNNSQGNGDDAASSLLPMDISALQSALASKEAEVEALKRALKLRDRQLMQQASQQSTTSLIGEAVLAQSTAAVATVAASAASHMSTSAANLVGSIDPNQISNLQQRWKARFQQLVCFKLKFGHTNVPKSFDASLHAWVRKQRVNKQIRDKTNGARGLTMHQVNSLEALDFQFVVGYQSKDDDWAKNYQKLMVLSHEQGHLEASNDKALGKWCQNQRARRKLLEQKGPGKAKGMTWERVQKLDAIGFRWDTKK